MGEQKKKFEKQIQACGSNIVTICSNSLEEVHLGCPGGKKSLQLSQSNS